MASPGRGLPRAVAPRPDVSLSFHRESGRSWLGDAGRATLRVSVRLRSRECALQSRARACRARRFSAGCPDDETRSIDAGADLEERTTGATPPFQADRGAA